MHLGKSFFSSKIVEGGKKCLLLLQRDKSRLILFRREGFFLPAEERRVHFAAGEGDHAQERDAGEKKHDKHGSTLFQ